MQSLAQFLDRDLWMLELEKEPFLKRWGFRALRLILAVSWEFRHRLLTARAAGLVYTSLLSLVPFLAVVVSVLKAFGVHHRMEPILSQLVEPLGPNGQQISVRVTEFVNNLDVGVLGVVGIAGLFYTTYSLIEKVEDTLNAIWRVRSGRPWTRKFTDYLSVVLVGPVVVMSAFGLLASVQSNALVQQVLEIQPFGYVMVWAAHYLPFVLLCGLFTFIYKFIPHTEVSLSAAIVGGATAALLWGVAGEGFAAFVASSTRYSAIYSGFAILILFLLWLYAGWLIILVGAQVAFFYQYPHAYEPPYRWAQSAYAWRERAALRLLRCLARRYLRGESPYHLEELAAETDVPVPIVEELTELFVDTGYLSRLAERHKIGFVKPPALMTLESLLEVIRHGASDPPRDAHGHDQVDAVLRQRDAAVRRALAGMTLESLAAEQGLEGSGQSGLEGKGPSVSTEERKSSAHRETDGTA